MRIAIISTLQGGSWGGSEALWVELARKAREQHEVIVCIEEKQYASVSIKRKLEGLNTILTWSNTGKQNRYRKVFSKKPLYYISSLLKINTFSKLSQLQPDVLFISQGGFVDTLHNPDLQEFLLRTDIPYFIVTHSFNPTDVQHDHWRKILQQLHLKAANNYFVASSQLSEIERCIGTFISNSRIILNPLKIKFKTPLPFNFTETKHFCMLSSLETKWKGQDLIIHALSTEKWRKRNWILNIYGQGNDLKYLKSLIKNYNMENYIFLKGETHEVEKVLSESHLVLFPSRQDVVPLSMLEAMSCARPVLVTRIGGMAEWVKDGITGYIAEAPNTYSLDLAMEKAWVTQDNWEIMGQNGFKKVSSRYGEDPLNEILTELEKTKP